MSDLPLHQRLYHFSRSVYEPKLHLLFAFGWCLSLQATFIAQQSLSNPSLNFSWGWEHYSIGLSFFLVLFFLRAVDEIKDFQYDKQFNPDRPLVTGAVSFLDIKFLIAVLIVITASMNLMLSPLMMLAVLTIMMYGLWLVKLEKISKTIESNILLNLMVTFPVSASLNFYCLYFLISQTSLHYQSSQWLIILAYMSAFLHFEFGRKTQWPVTADPGERLYSQVLGASGAAILCFLLGILSVCLMLLATSHLAEQAYAWMRYLVVLTLIPSLFSVKKFFENKNKRLSPRKYYVYYLVLFYVANLISSVMLTSH